MIGSAPRSVALFRFEFICMNGIYLAKLYSVATAAPSFASICLDQLERRLSLGTVRVSDSALIQHMILI
jgi:hypothetical protein